MYSSHIENIQPQPEIATVPRNEIPEIKFGPDVVGVESIAIRIFHSLSQIERVRFLIRRDGPI